MAKNITITRRERTTLAEITTRITTFAGFAVDAGIVGPEATAKHPGSNLTIAALGAVHNFGIEVPERPWATSVLESGALRRRIGGVYSGGLRKIMRGRGTARDLLDRVGETVSDAMKAVIDDGLEPLAESTLARKGRASRGPPLRDTDVLYDAITWRVRTD